MAKQKSFVNKVNKNKSWKYNKGKKNVFLRHRLTTTAEGPVLDRWVIRVITEVLTYK